MPPRRRCPLPTQSLPKLLTPGVMAVRLGVSVVRVQGILATRSHIRPAAVAGTLRVYDGEALAQLRHELNAIDARRQRKKTQGTGGSLPPDLP